MVRHHPAGPLIFIVDSCLICSLAADLSLYFHLNVFDLLDFGTFVYLDYSQPNAGQFNDSNFHGFFFQLIGLFTLSADPRFKTSCEYIWKPVVFQIYSHEVLKLLE